MVTKYLHAELRVGWHNIYATILEHLRHLCSIILVTHDLHYRKVFRASRSRAAHANACFNYRGVTPTMNDGLRMMN